MLKSAKALGSILVTAIMAGILLFNPASAAEKYKIHIQISPGKETMELKPGEVKTGKMKVQNIGTDPFDYKLEALPYQVSNNLYESDFSKENSYTQISKWITFPKPSANLKPGETDEVEFVVNVPYDVPAGGQYAAISASTDSGSSANSVIKTTKGVAMKLIARVAGATRQSGRIIDNKIDSVLFSPPIKASSLVESSSNVDILAEYNLTVRNFFTGQLAYSSEHDLNALKKNEILPDSQFLNEIRWNGSPHIGLFRVKQTVKLLNEISVEEKVVLICPLWLLFLILTIVFLSAFWLVTRIKQHKTAKTIGRF